MRLRPPPRVYAPAPPPIPDEQELFTRNVETQTAAAATLPEPDPAVHHHANDRANGQQDASVAQTSDEAATPTEPSFADDANLSEWVSLETPTGDGQ